LLEHCAHARFVWNLAVEQHRHWQLGRKAAPGFVEQARQLTEARAAFAWLRTGSVIVQQQALKDFAQATANFFSGSHRRPTWRKKGKNEGFRIVGERGNQWDVRRVSRKTGQVRIAERGSARRRRTKIAISRLKAGETNRRKDWVEKISTDLARRFDVIRVEDLKIPNMVRTARGTVEVPGHGVRQKAGLNRSIHRAGWGRLVTRLEHKAPCRVEKINPAYTSQRCSACGTVDAKARESQAVFRCRSCGHTANADVNAAKNIAVGRTVTARGGTPLGEPVNRESQLLTS
jgi:IS605 OrfB family transposase